MLTSNSLPMLGSARNGGTRRFSPAGHRDHSGRYWDLQRRVARRAEEARVVVDLAGWDDGTLDRWDARVAYLAAVEAVDELVEAMTEDDWSLLAEYDGEAAVLAEYGAVTYRDLFETLEREMVRQIGAESDDEGVYLGGYDLVGGQVVRMGERELDDSDLPGWGAARVDFSEYAGFRVTTRP